MRFPWQRLPISLQSTRYFSSLPSHCSSNLTRPAPTTPSSTCLNAPFSSFSSRCSPAFSSNLTRPTPSTPSSTPLNLLYLNVSHSPNSLVAVGAQALLEGIKREHKVKTSLFLSKIFRSVYIIRNTSCSDPVPKNVKNYCLRFRRWTSGARRA